MCYLCRDAEAWADAMGVTNPTRYSTLCDSCKESPVCFDNQHCPCHIGDDGEVICESCYQDSIHATATKPAPHEGEEG